MPNTAVRAGFSERPSATSIDRRLFVALAAGAAGGAALRTMDWVAPALATNVSPPKRTLAVLRAALAGGSTTSRALVEECLERIADKSGEGSRAFLHVAQGSARKTADAMDALREAGAAPSPYAGIPVAIKDLFDVAGEVTTAGSRVLADAPPAAADAPAVARLRRAGFVIIGRTNMTEFAYSGLGLNPHFGTPLSPWERTTGRVPGGSSSGSAVSVADAMAHAAIGTDTGGSCRIPAAFCGIVGHKPTARRVSLHGVIPLAPSLDSVGPLARSVACCATLEAILADESDYDLDNRPIEGLRLAVPQTLVLDGIDGHVAGAFEAALTRLEKAGARLHRIDVPEFAEIPAMNAKGGFPAAESYAWHRALIERKREAYDPRVIGRILRGREQGAADYLDLVAARRSLIARAEARLSRYDALVMPTVPIVPPPIADLGSDEAYGRINLLVLRNPTVINMIDGCAISIPIHQPGAPPVGLTVAGLAASDTRVLSIAASIETALN